MSVKALEHAEICDMVSSGVKSLYSCIIRIKTINEKSQLLMMSELDY